MAVGTAQTQAPMSGGPSNTVSESRDVTTWWTTPAGTTTPYTSAYQFR